MNETWQPLQRFLSSDDPGDFAFKGIDGEILMYAHSETGGTLFLDETGRPHVYDPLTERYRRTSRRRALLALEDTEEDDVMVFSSPIDAADYIAPDPTVPGWSYQGLLAHLDARHRFRCINRVSFSTLSHPESLRREAEPLIECRSPFALLVIQREDGPDEVREEDTAAWPMLREGVAAHGAELLDALLVARGRWHSVAYAAGEPSEWFFARPKVTNSWAMTAGPLG